MIFWRGFERLKRNCAEWSCWWEEKRSRGRCWCDEKRLAGDEVLPAWSMRRGKQAERNRGPRLQKGRKGGTVRWSEKSEFNLIICKCVQKKEGKKARELAPICAELP